MKKATRHSGQIAKQLICVLLIALSLFAPVSSVASIWGNGAVAEAVTRGNQIYKQHYAFNLPKYTGKQKSLVNALNEMGINSSYSHRKYLAQTNGMPNYTGKANENTQLLNLLKKGQMKIYWQIRMTPITKLSRAELKRNPTFKVEFRGYGISSCKYTSNNEALVKTDTKNTKLTNPGDWSYTTAVLQSSGLFWGKATTNVVLIKGNTKIAYPVDVTVTLM